MLLKELSADDQQLVMPRPGGGMYYVCLHCGQKSAIDELLYTCPACGGILLIDDEAPRQLSPEQWRRCFDLRKLINLPALKGIFRYHELIAPIIPLDSILYLGEGHTPLVEASPELAAKAGCALPIKMTAKTPAPHSRTGAWPWP
jgi:threonine synthase